MKVRNLLEILNKFAEKAPEVYEYELRFNGADQPYTPHRIDVLKDKREVWLKEVWPELKSPPPSDDPAPRLRFTFRRTYEDPEGYYYTRWDRAVTIQVVASTEAEAYSKLWAMSGEPPAGRRWVAVLKEVREADDA